MTGAIRGRHMKVTIEEGEPLDAYRWLTDYADHLNGISRRGWLGFPFYDLLAGAIVWTDETRRLGRQRTPVEVVWSLRCLWAYRTSLMLGTPREELAPYWQFGVEHFPNWVGFHPARRVSTPRLLRIYRKGEAQTDKLADDLNRMVAGSDADETVQSTHATSNRARH